MKKLLLILKKLVKIFKNKLGKESEEAAYTYNLIENVHCEMVDLENTMKYFIEAIMIEKSRLGRNHLDIVNILEVVIGNVFKGRKKYRNALVCF